MTLHPPPALRVTLTLVLLVLGITKMTAQRSVPSPENEIHGFSGDQPTADSPVPSTRPEHGVPNFAGEQRNPNPAKAKDRIATTSDGELSTFESRTLWITGLGVVAAVVVLVVQVFQLNEMKKANDAAGAAARAAEQSAKAALDAVAVQKLSNQQWLNGEWSAFAEDRDDRRSVQVSLKLVNPTSMNVRLKSVTAEVSSRATSSEVTIINMFEILRDQGRPVDIGPTGSFPLFLAHLPWMDEDQDRGALVTARIVFSDAFGQDSLSQQSAIVTWVNGKVIVSSGPGLTERIPNNDKRMSAPPSNGEPR